MTLADGLPLDLVESTEKGREKDRRQVTREEKILQQKEEHVSRVLASATDLQKLSEHADFELLVLEWTWQQCAAQPMGRSSL